MMTTLHSGYGGITGRGNYRIHKMLLKMNSQEREEYELKLKKEDEKRYNSFKKWQKEHMEIFS